MNKDQIVEHYIKRIDKVHSKIVESFEKGDFKRGHTNYVLSKSYLEIGICEKWKGNDGKAITLFSKSLEIYKDLISLYLNDPKSIKDGFFSHVTTWPYDVAYLIDDIETIKWLREKWTESSKSEGSEWYKSYQYVLADLFLGDSAITPERVDSLKQSMFPDVKAQTELVCAIASDSHKDLDIKWEQYKSDQDRYIQNEFEYGLPSILTFDGAALLKLTCKYAEVNLDQVGQNYRFNKSKHSDSVNAAGV